MSQNHKVGADVLKDLCFEIIQKCTNNCQFCSSCASMDADKIIGFEQFKEVIDYIMANGGLKEISISGGEPFLHKDLLRMVKLCKSYKQDIKTNVYTSGVIENKPSPPFNEGNYMHFEKKLMELHKRVYEQYARRKFSEIDKETLWNLKVAGLDKIVFDFQAQDIERYDEVMGTKGNITCLIRSMVYAKSVGLFTEVHYIPMKVNHMEIEDILEMCDDGEIDRISILKFVPQGRGSQNKEKLMLSDEELKEFCVKLESLKKKYKVKVRMGIPMTKKDEHLCTAGRNKLAIRYDGMVLPCVAFKEIDGEDLAGVLARNKIGFEVFSIKDGMDRLVYRPGSNKVPICKQVYSQIVDSKNQDARGL